jgi:aspartyl-tRNA(Asn)/glutamyl-tRNA(Gln) amidotransferase subunit B
MTTATDYEAVIGLEVHVQLKTRSKMFCDIPNEYGAPPNTLVGPVDLGLPGVLPVPNEEAIIKTILTGLMLGCRIAPRCKFDRKNYFYPDMPKNYQISQYDEPLCVGGGVALDLFAFPKDVQKDPATAAGKEVRLIRIHLEEDVAKSTHGDKTSGIDFNRAGAPLMEIVSEADIRTPEEAFAYLTALKQILIYGEVSDADMEKGQLRCDVNVSVRPRGQKEYGTKVELKNLNSISGVRRGLRYEIARQIRCLEDGEKIYQSTWRWDDAKGETQEMRRKESAHDYRYFPDPDLLPVDTSQGLLEAARKRIPELPAAKKARLRETYGVSEYQAGVLASSKALADYYENAAGSAQNPVGVANYLLNDYLATGVNADDGLPLPPVYFTELANLLENGTINSKQAKEVFARMVQDGKSPAALVKELDLATADESSIEKWCDEAIVANRESVESFRAGNPNAINRILGQVMKASKSSAHPKKVREILERKLGP